MRYCAGLLGFASLLVIDSAGAIGSDAKPPTTVANIETLQGKVLEKRSNVKSLEAWNTPSDPYYILVLEEKGGDKKLPARHITLRPSKKVSTANLKKFRGMRVSVRGNFVQGKIYKPAEGESFPIEVIEPIEVDPNAKPIEPRPARRGSGFVVTEITKQKG